MSNILNFFPIHISNILSKHINNLQDLEEIRLRTEKPIILKFLEKEVVVPYYTNRRRNVKDYTNNL